MFPEGERKPRRTLEPLAADEVASTAATRIAAAVEMRSVAFMGASLLIGTHPPRALQRCRHAGVTISLRREDELAHELADALRVLDREHVAGVRETLEPRVGGERRGELLGVLDRHDRIGLAGELEDRALDPVEPRAEIERQHLAAEEVLSDLV